jgi:hypothetical protein
MGDVADDAGVRQLGEHLDLAREALGVAGPLLGEDLDGHRVAGGAIAGAEDPAHAARADLVLELEPLTKDRFGFHWTRSKRLLRRGLLNGLGFDDMGIIRCQCTSRALMQSARARRATCARARGS